MSFPGSFAFRGDPYRTSAEQDMDEQAAVLKAAIALKAAGGTPEQIQLADRAERMARGRLDAAQGRVDQERQR